MCASCAGHTGGVRNKKGGRELARRVRSSAQPCSAAPHPCHSPGCTQPLLSVPSTCPSSGGKKGKMRARRAAPLAILACLVIAGKPKGLIGLPFAPSCDVSARRRSGRPSSGWGSHTHVCGFDDGVGTPRRAEEEAMLTRLARGPSRLNIALQELVEPVLQPRTRAAGMKSPRTFVGVATLTK